MSDAQYKYDLKAHDFHWAQAQDDYWYQMDEVETQRVNEQALHKYKTDQQNAQWAANEAARVTNYETQVRAYNSSVAAANQQLDYNMLAEEIAVSEENRVYQEQLLELGFKNENIMLQYTSGLGKLEDEQATRTENAELRRSIDTRRAEESKKTADQLADLAQRTTETQAARVQSKDISQAQLKADQTMESLGEQYARQEEDLGLKYSQGLDNIDLKRLQTKESLANQSVTQMEVAQKDMQARLSQLELEGDATDKQVQLQINQIKAQLPRMQARIDTARKQVEFSKDAAERKAGLQIEGLRQGLASQKAKAAYEAQEKKVALLTAEGKIAAGGQTGKSAAKRMHALMSSHGRGQAAILDTLARADKKYGLDRSTIANTLQDAATSADLNYEELSNQLLDSTLQFRHQTETAALNSRLSNLKTETLSKEAVKEFELKEHQISRGQLLQISHTDQAADIQEEHLTTSTELGQAQAQRSFETQFGQAAGTRDFTIGQATADFLSTTGIAADKRDQALEQASREFAMGIHHADSRASLQIDQATRDFLTGKTQMGSERDLNIEQTKEMVKSAGDAHINKSNQITLDKFQNDTKAQAGIRPEPVEPPQAARPLELPMTQFQDPKSISEPPAPVKGATYQPQAQGGQKKPGFASNLLSSVAIGIANPVAGIANFVSGLFCDDRLKTSVAPLRESEVADELAEFAFFVKELREYH